MASFYAELHLNGHAYPVRLCHFTLHQDTDSRGRVVGKVRHGPLGLTLDVPDGDELLAWAAAPYKPLAGEVVFFDLTAQMPHETIAFAAGQCVGYHEEFEDGNSGPGAYTCHLLITAPAFTLAAGGPAAPLAAAVRGWAGPSSAGETHTPRLSSEAGISAAAARSAAVLSPELITMLDSTLLVAPSAGTGGTAAFEAIVKADLQAIYDTPTGKQLLDSLHASGKKIYIEPV